MSSFEDADLILFPLRTTLNGIKNMSDSGLFNEGDGKRNEDTLSW